MTCGLLLNLESFFLQKNPLLNLKKRAITRKIMALKKKENESSFVISILLSHAMSVYLFYLFTRKQRRPLWVLDTIVPDNPLLCLLSQCFPLTRLTSSNARFKPFDVHQQLNS